MERLKKQMVFLSLLALLFLLIGFLICTISPENVYIGVGIIVLGVLVSFSSLVFSLKMYALHTQQTEDRIKKLEEEVNFLKKSITHK